MGEQALIADLFGSTKVAHDPGGRHLPLPPGVVASAVYAGLRDCYRHRLEWTWAPSLPTLMGLGMNPSTAGHLNGDATICKLHRMAVRRGFGRLLMGNVFGYRATDQSRLAEVADPTGDPANWQHVCAMAQEADEVWVCYGRPKLRRLQADGPSLARLIVADGSGHKLRALRASSDGTPWHPLYLPDSAEPMAWMPPAPNCGTADKRAVTGGADGG